MSDSDSLDVDGDDVVQRPAFITRQMQDPKFRAMQGVMEQMMLAKMAKYAASSPSDDVKEDAADDGDVLVDEDANFDEPPSPDEHDPSLMGDLKSRKKAPKKKKAKKDKSSKGKKGKKGKKAKKVRESVADNMERDESGAITGFEAVDGTIIRCEDRVVVTQKKRRRVGVVRYVGKVDGGDIRVGVALYDCTKGTTDGGDYFSARPNQGLFVDLTAVHRYKIRVTNITDIKYCGYCSVVNPSKSSSKPKRRWCVLTEHYLYYFKSPWSDKELGRIVVKNRNCEKHSDDPHAIIVTVKTGKFIHLLCHDGVDADGWLEAIMALWDFAEDRNHAMNLQFNLLQEMVSAGKMKGKVSKLRETTLVDGEESEGTPGPTRSKADYSSDHRTPSSPYKPTRSGVEENGKDEHERPSSQEKSPSPDGREAPDQAETVAQEKKKKKKKKKKKSNKEPKSPQQPEERGHHDETDAQAGDDVCHVHGGDDEGDDHGDDDEGDVHDDDDDEGDDHGKDESVATVSKTAVVLFDFHPDQEDEIPLRKGDEVVVFEMDESGWWTGECNGKYGLFPGDFAQLLSSEDGTPRSTGHHDDALETKVDDDSIQDDSDVETVNSLANHDESQTERPEPCTQPSTINEKSQEEKQRKTKKKTKKKNKKKKKKRKGAKSSEKQNEDAEQVEEKRVSSDEVEEERVKEEEVEVKGEEEDVEEIEEEDLESEEVHGDKLVEPGEQVKENDDGIDDKEEDEAVDDDDEDEAVDDDDEDEAVDDGEDEAVDDGEDEAVDDEEDMGDDDEADMGDDDDEDEAVDDEEDEAVDDGEDEAVDDDENEAVDDDENEADDDDENEADDDEIVDDNNAPPSEAKDDSNIKSPAPTLPVLIMTNDDDSSPLTTPSSARLSKKDKASDGDVHASPKSARRNRSAQSANPSSKEESRLLTSIARTGNVAMGQDSKKAFEDRLKKERERRRAEAMRKKAERAAAKKAKKPGEGK